MKKLFPLFILSIFFCILVSESCTKDIGVVPAPAFVPDSTAKYSSVIVPLLTTYCYGTGSQTCHVAVSNQGSPGDFTKYQDLKNYVDDGKFNDRVFVKKDMPPSYSSGPTVITAADLNKFKSWIVLGAQNN